MSHSHGCVLWNVALGRYDFDTFTVLLARHDDPELMQVTARHEFLHHRLTNASTFGLLIERIKHEADTSADQRYGQLLQVLVDACRGVHEMVATYYSLVAYGRRDLLARLPNDYRDAFQRCAALVEREFDTDLLRTDYSMALGRCAMMTEPGNYVRVGPDGAQTETHAEDQLVNDLLSGSRTELPESHDPDLRFNRMERALLALPRGTLARKLSKCSYDDVELLLTCECEEALNEALGGDQQRKLRGLASLSQSLMFALCEVLEEYVPGLSDSYSTFRARSAALMSLEEQWVPGFGASRGEIRVIRDMAAQTVALTDGSLPPIEFIDGRPVELERLAQSSLRKTGALYLYAECRADQAEPALFLTGLEHRPYPVLRCCVLAKGDVSHLAERVTIIEWEDLRRLGKSSGAEEFAHGFGRKCFAHIAGNPMDYLIPFIAAGHSVRWTVVGVTDPTNTVRSEHQLQLVLYRIGGYWLFHLSNPLLTMAVMALTEVVSDRNAIACVPLRTKGRSSIGALKQRRDRKALEDHVIAPICAHPIVTSFYLLGRQPRLLSSRKASAGASVSSDFHHGPR